MQNVSVSRRYARALLEAAGPDVDAVASQLEALMALFGAHADIRAAVGSPTFTRVQRLAAVDVLARIAGLHLQLANLLRLLVDRNRFDQLPVLARCFADMVDARLGRVRGKVVSATQLSDAQRTALRGAVQAITGKDVLLEASVDAQLIGGVVAQVGSRTYDGSLRTQLRQLRQELSQPVA